MEAQLGYMDEKELGVQKPKKPPEIPVRVMLVSGPLADVGWGLGLGASSGLAQSFSWLQVWASGFRRPRGKPGEWARSLPSTPVEAPTCAP